MEIQKHWQNLSLINIDGEIWEKIPGYENSYEVSNLGRVKSLFRRTKNGRATRLIKEKIKKQYLMPNGYLEIGLSLLGSCKRTHNLVHRIVALAFIPNPDSLPEVNHKLGIRDDNRVSELEWSTCSNNRLHAYRILGRINPRGMAGKTGILNKKSKLVLCVTLGLQFNGARQAEKELEITKGSVSAICLGNRDSVNGLYFRYLT